jgi:hypothetical protein
VDTGNGKKRRKELLNRKSRVADPDFGPYRIPEPGSKNSNKREG